MRIEGRGVVKQAKEAIHGRAVSQKPWHIVAHADNCEYLRIDGAQGMSEKGDKEDGF